MIASAKLRSIEFLTAQCDRHGWWRDFNTLAGSSDEWVTAYVGSMLANVNDKRALRAAHRAWHLLNRRHPWLPGWGYNGRVPTDADSTLWVLYLAEGIGVRHSLRVRRAERFLRRSMRPDGALATYAKDGPIRLFTKLQRSISFEGWCGSHACVTAAAAGLYQFDGREHALDYLRQSQLSDGSWIGYWWCDRAYTTALTIAALMHNPTSNDRERIDRAFAWTITYLKSYIEDQVATGQSLPFVVAWCIRALTRAPDGPQAHQYLEMAVAHLLATQQPDGSWCSSARLRIPPPHVTDPEHYSGWVQDGRGGGSIQLDISRSFTTATVLMALHEAEQNLD